jgi:hypothetical protein
MNLNSNPADKNQNKCDRFHSRFLID